MRLRLVGLVFTPLLYARRQAQRAGLGVQVTCSPRPLECHPLQSAAPEAAEGDLEAPDAIV